MPSRRQSGVAGWDDVPAEACAVQSTWSVQPPYHDQRTARQEPRAPDPSRRAFLKAGAAIVAASCLARAAAPSDKKKTEFQIACMTLPYEQFPLERALTGIRNSGYTYVAWGTTHKENGKDVPVMATDAPPEKARELGKRCRDLSLTPVLMFTGIYPENKDAIAIFTSRIKQASAAAIPQVLTFGHTEGGHRELWVKRF